MTVFHHVMDVIVTNSLPCYNLFKYKLSDIIELTDESRLIIQYRQYIRRLSLNEIIDIYEWLITLSEKQLTGLRLEYTPRNAIFCASLNIIVSTENSYGKNLIWKSVDDNHSPRYSWYKG